MSHPQSFINSKSTEEVTTQPETADVPLKKLPRRFIWMLLGTTLAISIGGGWLLLRHTSTPNPLDAELTPVQVETEVVRKQLISGIQNLTGTVEPVETVTTTSRVMGQITSLPVKEGDRVKAGQVLARIDVNDIQAQRNQATAAISQSQAGVTVAQAAQNQASTLQNQALALVNQAVSRKQQALAQLQETEAELAKARLDQQRMAMLRLEGAVPQAQLDEANTQVSVIQTRIQQAEAGIEQANQGIEAAKAGLEQAKAGVEQARAGVKQAMSQVKQAQAVKQQAIANLDYGIVTAPFNGVVTRKHTEVGAMAGAGQPLVTLEGTEHLRFSVEIPESLISQVRQGELVKIRLDALNQSLSGPVTQIIPSANPSSRSFTIKIALSSITQVMPGMFGRLELPLSGRPGIFIPTHVLIRRGQLEGVYVVEGNHQATLRWVKTGKVQDEQVEITSGLAESDHIIISNLSQLTDGQAVTMNNQQ
jgi:RND family efflux transporter MFP subunit